MNSFSMIINGSNYELNQPEWLWLFLACILIHITFKLINSNYFTASKPARLSNLSSNKVFLHPILNLLSIGTEKNQLSSPPLLFNYILLFSLIAALTQPTRVGERLPEPPQERDIVFIVDTSVSMILRDYILDGKRIDRMNLLKGVLDQFIVKLKGERMSIIVFGDTAFTLVPLTSDQHLLRRMLARVQATMAGRFNAMGEGIALAVKQANDINQKNNGRKQILVLLTDADQPTGNIEPSTAAKLASDAKLPLYTIAIGATSLAAEEIRLGGLLYSPVDIKLIERLATITGAKNYQAGSPDALKNAIQEINLHETNKRKVDPQYIHQPLYFWPLIIALILFTLNQFLSFLKNRPTKQNILSRKTQK